MTRPPLLPFDDALERLLAQARAVDEHESVPVMEAHGRVLARAVLSTIDVPRADNTQMDGYAVRAAEATAGARLPLSQPTPAGRVGGPLEPGAAGLPVTGVLI